MPNRERIRLLETFLAAYEEFKNEWAPRDAKIKELLDMSTVLLQLLKNDTIEGLKQEGGGAASG